MFEWDEEKRAANLAKHGVDFAVVQRIDWSAALTAEDIRTAYGEQRFVTLAEIDGRLHFCAWTRRGGQIRIISLRKANRREQTIFSAQTPDR